MDGSRIALKVNDRDNVATIFANGIHNGSEVELRDKKGFVETLTVHGEIPYGHKIAVRDIKLGELIFKYGEEIGIATQNIKKAIMSISRTSTACAAGATCQNGRKIIMAYEFMGYVRPDGQVGCRNHVAVMPSVTCAGDVASAIVRQVAGTVGYFHHQGCCQLPPDLDRVTETLISLGKSPNVAAVLVVSLGCEGTDHERLTAEIRKTGKPSASSAFRNWAVSAPPSRPVSMPRRSW